MLLQATRTTALRSSASPSTSISSTTSQVRHATLLRRPKRPYTFTQLVTLSDGSTYFQRTTSPQPVYQSIKDSRNSALWNPTSEKLSNVEADEAGRLRAFREKYGRGWDAKDGKTSEVEQESREDEEGEEKGGLMDLLAEYATDQDSKSMNEPKKKSLQQGDVTDDCTQPPASEDRLRYDYKFDSRSLEYADGSYEHAPFLTYQYARSRRTGIETSWDMMEAKHKLRLNLNI